jgi:hypothetical protein
VPVRIAAPSAWLSRISRGKSTGASSLKLSAQVSLAALLVGSCGASSLASPPSSSDPQAANAAAARIMTTLVAARFMLAS